MQTTEPYFYHNMCTARVFTVVVVMMTGMIWLTRYVADGTGNDNGEFASLTRIVLMGLAIIWVRPLTDCFAKRHLSVVAFLGVMSLMFLPWGLLQILPHSFAKVLIDLIFAAFACGGLICSFKRHPVQGMAKNFLFGVLLSIAFFMVLVGQGYVTPFAYENALMGVQHHDTLYHAALTGIIEHHGTVSVGLDGLVPVFYHVLNHRLVGSIANWLDVPVLEALYLFAMVVTIPLLFKALCDAAYALKPQGWPPISPLPALIFFLCWPMIFSLLQPSAYFSSESYILSLVILLMAMPIMIEWSNKRPSGLGFWVYALTLTIAVLLAGMAKISTGAVLAAGLVGLFVLAGQFSVMSFVWAAVFSVAPFLLLFSSFQGAGTQASDLFSPFHFLIEWREAALFHIILVAVTGGLIWVFRNQCPKKSVVVTALYLMALAAVGSSLILKLEAGAAIYFANPGMWICILLLAVAMPTPKWPNGVTSNAQFLIAMLVFVAIAALEKDRWNSIDVFASENAQGHELSLQSKLINMALINQIDKSIEEQGRRFLVFVGPQFDSFWSQRNLCWSQSFVIPALTGQPMLKGLPPKNQECEKTGNYGLSGYDWNISASETQNDDQLCIAAKKRNYSAVLRFDDQYGRFVDCRK